MSDEEEEIDITTLPLEELYELMGEDLYDGYADEVTAEVHEALSRGQETISGFDQRFGCRYGYRRN